jgi:hypothetical protein
VNAPKAAFERNLPQGRGNGPSCVILNDPPLACVRMVMSADHSPRLSFFVRTRRRMVVDRETSRDVYPILGAAMHAPAADN